MVESLFIYLLMSYSNRRRVRVLLLRQDRPGYQRRNLRRWAAHARTAAQSSVAAHLLQSFWLLSEHWACAAELSKPVFLNTTFCE